MSKIRQAPIFRVGDVVKVSFASSTSHAKVLEDRGIHDGGSRRYLVEMFEWFVDQTMLDIQDTCRMEVPEGEMTMAEPIKTEQVPRLRVGDLVSFAHGRTNVLAKVLVDRGCLGVRGQRIYQAEPLNRPGWTDPVEVPEDEIREVIIMGDPLISNQSQ